MGNFVIKKRITLFVKEKMITTYEPRAVVSMRQDEAIAIPFLR